MVEVDTTKPAVNLLQPTIGTGADEGTMLITWTAADKNLLSNSVNLYYATQSEGPWTGDRPRVQERGRLPLGDADRADRGHLRPPGSDGPGRERRPARPEHAGQPGHRQGAGEGDRGRAGEVTRRRARSRQRRERWNNPRRRRLFQRSRRSRDRARRRLLAEAAGCSNAPGAPYSFSRRRQRELDLPRGSRTSWTTVPAGPEDDRLVPRVHVRPPVRELRRAARSPAPAAGPGRRRAVYVTGTRSLTTYRAGLAKASARITSQLATGTSSP